MSVRDLVAKLELPFESHLPGFDGATTWLNSEPLTTEELRGKVVLVDFGTFTCINWLRTLPYIRAWDAKYRAQGLVTIGVQTPEFQLEHDIESIRRALAEMHVEYPVVVDNDFQIWDAFANRYWPALYLADHDGRIRHHHFGEGGYEQTERAIQRLLRDAGATDVSTDLARAVAQGIEIEGDAHNTRSPETYVGLARGEGLASPELPEFEVATDFTVPPRLHTNQWAFDGNWTVGREEAVNSSAGARIVYRFHARDLNLILAPTTTAPVRFRVRLGDEAPQAARGLDVDEDGQGVVNEPRLYQLIRQPGPIEDQQFEIEFLDPGASALCFTFG